MKERSITRVILSNIIGILIFFVLLAIANFLIPYFPNDKFITMIDFLNSNINLIVILTFFGMLSEIFWTFSFPFNLISPIISAIFSSYLITFIFRLWNLVKDYIKVEVNIPIDLIYIGVFALVIIFGYLSIFIRFFKKRNKESQEYEEEKEEEKPMKKEKKQKEEKTHLIKWEKVGNEFRLLFFNIGKSLNRLFEKKKRK